MSPPVDDTFRPPGAAWVRVSPRLATARRLTMALVAAPMLALLGVLAAVGVDLVVVAVGLFALVAVCGWMWWLIGRRVRSIGYAERDDDLLVTSGIVFRRLVIVPYGRMQLVDVRAGPIDRSLGVTSVQLHTAAATTDAQIPGLGPEEAAALRDRLAARGEVRSSGL